MKKVLTVTGKIVLGLFIIIFLFLTVSIAPVDRTLPVDQPFYNVMMQRIDSLASIKSSKPIEEFKVGIGKASITPAYPTATAGYVKRNGAKFTTIRDSIFARTIIIEQGEKKVVLVSLDMLIVPPLLYKRLVSRLPSINFSIDKVYLGATHSHNSIGQWDDHLVGETYAGDYDSKLLDFVADQILLSIQKAQSDIQLARLKHGVVPVRDAVNNRLIRNGYVDSLLHVIEINREDGSKGIFTSYTAHATCMSSKDLSLSRDYPGDLVDRFEKGGYTFAMFMAGAVGSHAPIAMDDGTEKIQAMSYKLYAAATQANLKEVNDFTFRFHRIPLEIGKQQIKVLPNWRVREWLSLPLIGEFKPSLTFLRLGDIVFLGAPCDFSGMLTGPIYATAQQHNLHSLVTSFNGGYIGYITPDKYFDLDRYETQIMNWYGAGNGSYLQECFIRMIEKL